MVCSWYTRYNIVPMTRCHGICTLRYYVIQWRDVRALRDYITQIVWYLYAQLYQRSITVHQCYGVDTLRYYAVVHPINAKIFTSKSRTVRVIASTWIIAILLALPYLYCKSYTFSISSHLGSVSRFICTDRFDDIDLMMYAGDDDDDDDGTRSRPTGRFRKGFFLFLFVLMYVLPSVIILFTCVRIAISLCRPVAALERSSASFKSEENKRKVCTVDVNIFI